MSELQQLVECVPNFSEGRDPKVIQQMVDALAGSGVNVLHVDSSFDANRTVVTFVGSIEQVIAGAKSLVAAARECIDMRVQQGAHPRLGAIDVCPFIPLQNVDRSALQAAVNEFAAEVSHYFDLPVFLYARSARSEERAQLADIRRGEYEGLPEKLQQPQWQPDFGPARAHEQLGALVTGVRDILVAFNVNISAAPVAVSRRIAARVRQYGPWIKAIGWEMPEYGCTQVSMNLLRFWEFGMYDAFEACQVEAEYHECVVTGSELIGLVPQAALEAVGRRLVTDADASPEQHLSAAEEYLGLSSVRPFSRAEQVLELALGLPKALPFPYPLE